MIRERTNALVAMKFRSSVPSCKPSRAAIENTPNLRFSSRDTAAREPCYCGEMTKNRRGNDDLFISNAPSPEKLTGQAFRPL